MHEEEYTPHLYICKDSVLIAIGDIEIYFPFEVWDAMVRFANKVRAGEHETGSELIQALPEKIEWDGTLPQ